MNIKAIIEARRTRRALKREYAELLYVLDACHSERKRLRKASYGPLYLPQIEGVARAEDRALERMREITKELAR